MESGSPRSKAEWRRYLRHYTSEHLTSEYRADASQRICASLMRIIEAQQPRRIALYMALPDEPDLSNILDPVAHRCEVYLPRVESAEMMKLYRYLGVDGLCREGKYQILEPTQTAGEAIDPSHIDLIVVPALAFDADGYRLGRGKGYYDRYLAQCKAYCVGVSLGLVPIERLPRDAWDLPMDVVLSPLTL